MQGDINASASVQSHHWAHALKLLRTIPQNRRTEPIQAQLSLLDKKIRENRAAERDEAKLYSASADITEDVNRQIALVTGKPRENAFECFIQSGLPISMLPLETDVRNNTTKELLHFLGSTILKDEFGNTIGEIPSFNPQGENQKLIKHMMVNTLTLHCRVLPIVKIFPQLHVLNSEHRFSLQFFRDIVEQSNIVPESRKEIFAKAFYAGMNEDFFTAIHLLAPQIEHMCRAITKEILHQSTIVRDAQGFESECSLNKLIEIPALRNFLTEPIAFYIETIFCRPDGGNLRNRVAHGTLSLENSLDPLLAFAWWFTLRLVSIYKIENRTQK